MPLFCTGQDVSFNKVMILCRLIVAAACSSMKRCRHVDGNLFNFPLNPPLKFGVIVDREIVATFVGLINVGALFIVIRDFTFKSSRYHVIIGIIFKPCEDCGAKQRSSSGFHVGKSPQQKWIYAIHLTEITLCCR